MQCDGTMVTIQSPRDPSRARMVNAALRQNRPPEIAIAPALYFTRRVLVKNFNEIILLTAYHTRLGVGIRNSGIPNDELKIFKNQKLACNPVAHSVSNMG